MKVILKFKKQSTTNLLELEDKFLLHQQSSNYSKCSF